MTEEHLSIIEFYEIEDGEKLCIEQYVEGERTGDVLMTRDVAVQLAHEILVMLE